MGNAIFFHQIPEKMERIILSWNTRQVKPSAMPYMFKKPLEQSIPTAFEHEKLPGKLVYPCTSLRFDATTREPNAAA